MYNSVGAFEYQMNSDVYNINRQETTQTVVSDRDPKRGSIISSFVSGIMENNTFGSIRVPREFHNTFGRHILVLVHLICKEGVVWEAEYRQVGTRIHGMDRFLVTHKATQQTVLIFDYLGKNIFKISIYKPCGIEMDFNNVTPRKCLSLHLDEPLVRNEYMVGMDMLEKLKSVSLLWVNGFYPSEVTYKIHMSDDCVRKHNKRLVLPVELKDLYKEWNDGDYINLFLIWKRWKVQIHKNGEYCAFGESWVKLRDELVLQSGDVLVLRRDKDSNGFCVCVFNRKDIHHLEEITGHERSVVSFYQFSNSHLLKSCQIALPYLVHRFYSRVLPKKVPVSCGEIKWPLSYDAHNGELNNFKDIFSKFKVDGGDTLFLTLSNESTAIMRIYRMDGMEINYSNDGLDRNSLEDSWFFDDMMDIPPFKVEPVDDDENMDNAVEDINYRELSFSETMKPSHVDGRFHGVYIPKAFESQVQERIVNTKVDFIYNKQTWKIGLISTNKRLRFCSGWSTFTVDNKIVPGDVLTFVMHEDRKTFDIQVETKV